MSHDMTSLTFSLAFRVSICQAEWLWPIANLKSLMPCNRPWTGDFKFKILDERKNYLVVSCVCPSAKCYIGHLGGPGTAGLNSQVSKNQNGVCPSGHLQHIKTERHWNVQIFYWKQLNSGFVCLSIESSDLSDNISLHRRFFSRLSSFCFLHSDFNLVCLCCHLAAVNSRVGSIIQLNLPLWIPT